MRILFVISTLTGGGAQRAMSNITMHLPEGVEADILLNSVSEEDFDTSAHKISLGMPIVEKMGLSYQLKAAALRVKALRRLKKNGHYDACISFMDSINICNILTGKKHCKTIISVRTSIRNANEPEYQYIVSPLIRLFYNRADCVVPVSEMLGKELIQHFKIREDLIAPITNGFDVNWIREQADQTPSEASYTALPGDAFIYLASGRYTPPKNHWHLIRAFAQIAKDHKDMVLVILGQGGEKDYLEQLIACYQMEEQIRLIPFQTNPFPYLKRSNVFAMPSGWEGYCNALCEALVCGLPCIATDFQTSAREILAPNTDLSYQNRTEIEYAEYGIITPVCSGTRYTGCELLEPAEELLAKAMLQMYEDTGLREKYRAAALERGEQMGIEEKVKEWMELVKKSR